MTRAALVIAFALLVIWLVVPGSTIGLNPATGVLEPMGAP